uniref:Uncharacterized protein AlNc14C15G1706 n=1 Tax=Albugo laibachii Nc14 TaxID=890382 RepID=F0W412_9STRA|nr:conserved hypothetical protein [Albugo laibachii Nc14]|eukprot:CCA15809.1 conserved hypothetical protein [Albugo laibachii Nc14]
MAMTSNKRPRTADSDTSDVVATKDVIVCSNINGSLPATANDQRQNLIEQYQQITRQIHERYSFVRALLNEFWSTFEATCPENPECLQVLSEGQWFWFMEMRFFIIFLYEMAFMEFSNCVTKTDSLTMNDDTTVKEVTIHRQDMQDRVGFLEFMKKYVCELGKYRLESSVESGKSLPRVYRLAKMYKLTDKELELLQLMIVYQGAQSNTVRCQMLEEDAQRRMMAYQRLAGISEIDIAEFYDDQREHVKEGTLIVDEESYGTTLSLSHICVRVLLGRKLSNHQALKLSQTALEELLKDEGMAFADMLDSEHSAKGSELPRPIKEKICQVEKEKDCELEILEKEAAESSAFAFIGDYTLENSERQIGQDKKQTTGMPLGSGVMKTDDLEPYNPSNQLEYLEDRFQIVAFAIRASGARVKDQMKEAGTKQPWETSAHANAGRRELKAKQRIYDRRAAHRLSLTRKAGLPLPRLEELSTKFKLTKFEQNVIVMLIGKTISPVIKNLIDGVDTSPVQRMDESIIINQILSVFCDTFQEQVAHRVFFYKSSRLLAKGLVKLHRGRWHSTTGDLVDQRVELDRRVLDWVVGLDTEINELVEGSDLYNPKVTLEQVVLPEEHKTTILQTVESYENFRKYRKKYELEDSFTHSSGLVLLLCGASGTGKTMTVNAVAQHLGKRVLLVDFPSLQGKRHEGVESDADLRGLVREAEMSNAVLFFDECETIFKQRDFGGDRLLNALLTEIERYEGIVFLATNRPFDLDEAMHRRITAVFEFQPPDHIQRQKIWHILLKNKLKTAEDIDWEAISLKYELSGGFIKNAILSALLKAISRSAEDPIINHEDIVAGCALQMRGSLRMKTFDHRVVPTSGLDSLIVESSVKSEFHQIVQFEKARSVIYGQWGFDFGESKSKQKGISVLIYGPPGIGKTNAAKSIGFEVGRPLKLVSFSQLQSDSAAETRKALRAVFDDARLMDAVLVLEGFESFGSHVDAGHNLDMKMEVPAIRMEAMRLIDMMDTFPGISILIADVESTACSSVPRSEFARRLKFLVQMRTPNAKLREKLWRGCFPPQAPVASNVDFVTLAERYQLTNREISNAVFRAAASAALRKLPERTIKMKDLTNAAQVEKDRSRAHSDAMSSLFV